MGGAVLRIGHLQREANREAKRFSGYIVSGNAAVICKLMGVE